MDTFIDVFVGTFKDLFFGFDQGQICIQVLHWK